MKQRSKPKQFEVVWHDAGKEPRCAPNPAYPNGIDIDLSLGAEETCVAELPYPASRIGGYIVRCLKCSTSGGCTTAGRPDDPRSVRLACGAEYTHTRKTYR